MSDEYKVDDLFFPKKDEVKNEQMQPMEPAGNPESILLRWEQWVKAVKG